MLFGKSGYSHFVRRALVPAVLALVPRCRRTAQRARPGSGPHDNLALGPGYGPELEERLRHHLKPTTKSWRVDETYVRVKGRWCYLYRAIDSSGTTIDFVLSRWRDAATATRLFRKALTDPSHPQPRVINTDQARLYGSAIAGVKKAGILRRRCRHRPVQYLNNIAEPDHRAIKRRVTAKQGFRAFHAAQRTLQGYEAMHMIRKGQARRVSGSDGRRQIQFINKLFAEVSHQSTRQRERQMRRFRSAAHLQRFASVHGVVQNLFRVGRHLLRAAHHRLLRARSFRQWDEVTCAC